MQLHAWVGEPSWIPESVPYATGFRSATSRASEAEKIVLLINSTKAELRAGILDGINTTRQPARFQIYCVICPRLQTICADANARTIQVDIFCNRKNILLYDLHGPFSLRCSFLYLLYSFAKF